MELSAESVVIGDLASDLVAQLAPLALLRGVRLSGSVSGAASDVVGDPGLLARVLQNIVGNAIAYTRAGTDVVVEVVTDDAVRVSVSDGCGGLDQADLARVFWAGWRGDQARSPGASSGNGLGLAIVRTIVAAHGGVVTMRNAGSGCIVEVELHRSAGGLRNPVQAG